MTYVTRGLGGKCVTDVVGVMIDGMRRDEWCRVRRREGLSEMGGTMWML